MKHLKFDLSVLWFTSTTMNKLMFLPPKIWLASVDYRKYLYRCINFIQYLSQITKSIIQTVVPKLS